MILAVLALAALTFGCVIYQLVRAAP